MSYGASSIPTRATFWRPGQMEQILLNLAVNAHAMPSGGNLTIKTTNRTFDQTYVQDHPGQGAICANRHEQHGRWNGPGNLSHIYEPFFTTKEKGKGTGLGLSTVYGIIKQSEGYITCYSEPGKGTTFTIYLPLTFQGADKPLVAPAPVAARWTETILLVDDDSAVRRLARIALEKAGYTVIEASGGEEALAAVRARNVSVALLVVDVVMPRMSGKELALKLREISPTARVLYISGYTASVISHHEILEAGIDFLQKPFSATELLTAARDIGQAIGETTPFATEDGGGFLHARRVAVDERLIRECSHSSSSSSRQATVIRRGLTRCASRATAPPGRPAWATCLFPSLIACRTAPPPVSSAW